MNSKAHSAVTAHKMESNFVMKDVRDFVSELMKLLKEQKAINETAGMEEAMREQKEDKSMGMDQRAGNVDDTDCELDTAQSHESGPSEDMLNWMRTVIIENDINRINNEMVIQDETQNSNRALPVNLVDILSEPITSTPLFVQTDTVSTNSISIKEWLEKLDKMQREIGNESVSGDGSTGFTEIRSASTMYVFSLSLCHSISAFQLIPSEFIEVVVQRAFT